MRGKVNDIQLAVSRMINAEYDEHAQLLNQIHSRSPAEKDKIIEQLRAIHQARIEVLERVLEEIKSIK